MIHRWCHGNWNARLFVAAVMLLVVVGAALPAAGQTITPATYSQLSYRYIGPPGNRSSAVLGVPGDPLTYYVGAAAGGIFKSTDGGYSWEPIFDDQPAQSIGALAIAFFRSQRHLGGNGRDLGSQQRLHR